MPSKRGPSHPRRAIQLLHYAPARRRRPLIVVDGDEKNPLRSYRSADVVKCAPHIPRVMQHTPAVHDVEASSASDVSRVQHRPFLDLPRGVARKVAALELARTGDRLRVVIE